MREHKYRPDVRMRTAAGVVTQGSQHHFTVSLGYEGAWFTVDGRMAELGFKNPLAWWSLDHRHNGVEEGGQAVSTRVTNTSAIRLGRTGDQSTSADIVVTKFAVFYSGVARVTRGQQTAGFTLADAQSLAGASGSALADPRFSAVSRSPAAGANTIQAAIDACTPNGTVFLSGSYTQTTNLLLKSGVRITTNGTATVTFTGNAICTNTPPSAMPALTGGGLLSAGASSYTVNNSLTNDGVFVVVDSTALGTLYQVSGVQNATAKKSDMIPIRSRTSTSITFTRAPFFTYPIGTRLATVGFTPLKDVAIDGAITLRKNGGTSNTPVVQLNGIRRLRFNNITVEQISTTITGLLCVQVKGCVEYSFSGCNFSTSSPQDPLDSAVHPYCCKNDGCAHYSIFNHTGFSADWNAGDNESDNIDDEWGLNSAVPAGIFGGQFGDWRKCTMTTPGFNFGVSTHTANHISLLDMLYTSGGGFTVSGYAHNFECVEASPGGNNTQLNIPRGAGAIRVWHCDFNNNLGNWGNGDFGLTKSSFGDLHYLTPPDTSTFSPVPHDGTNTFTDVDTATNGFPLS